MIVASQLLNEHSNQNSYKRQRLPLLCEEGLSRWETGQSFSPSRTGLLITGIIAFGFALSIRWLQNKVATNFDRSRFVLFLLVVSVSMMMFYYYIRHQWLHYRRTQAIENASLLMTAAQEFDAAASAGIVFIQEVELVSRGYNM